MSSTKVLICVKTYPSLSEKYDELVCTAGLTEQGEWIRIFPVPFRKLNYESQYEKWRWIELDLVRNTKDFRPESYRPKNIEKEIKIHDKVDSKHWSLRRKLVLNDVHTNLSELITKAKDKSDRTSLAILKPKEVLDFLWEKCDDEWPKKKIDAIIARQAQGSLFDIEDTRAIFKVVKKLPYKFKYKFITDDDKERTIMIEDWELGALFWKCLKLTNGDEERACMMVKNKYFDWMYKKRDLFFFMGTTLAHHATGKSPFLIIGTFYPPKIDQLSLF
ncbi:hypothetical protein [uncultured Draconibacterium sp.]|uniref:hypothetical protein n=1 Tax=uncultured Draconibacterium sp. TaxID=1573823 RepID=UPI0029C7E697|nr:hypothetical protein [uncultured Draconibacterium sp.]